jgi:hypothetical protein
VLPFLWPNAFKWASGNISGRSSNSEGIPDLKLFVGLFADAIRKTGNALSNVLFEFCCVFKAYRANTKQKMLFLNVYSSALFFYIIFFPKQTSDRRLIELFFLVNSSPNPQYDAKQLVQTLNTDPLAHLERSTSLVFYPVFVASRCLDF